MKKIIFTWAILLLPAITAFGQEASSADTGKGTTSHPPGAPADTGTFATPPPADTPAISPSTESAPADTGTTLAPQQESPASDTGSATPSEKRTPVDTGAAPIQPQETAPADTGAAPAPPQKISPVDTPAVAPLQPGLPGTEAAADEEITEAPKGGKPSRFGMGIVFNDEAPLSIRAWLNSKVGLDVGVGLKGRRVDDTASITDSTPTPERRVTMLDLSFDLGIPVRVLRKEKVDFIVRPGFGFRTRPGFFTSLEDTTVRSIETSLELEVNGSIGFEYYPFERASFGFITGFSFVAERTGGSGNTNFRLESLPSRKGVNFSFRYYIF